MKRIFLIHNPLAARASDRALGAIVRALESDGFRVSVGAIAAPGDATVLARQAVGESAEGEGEYARLHGLLRLENLDGAPLAPLGIAVER